MMAAKKRAWKRGRDIPDAQRHTVKVQIRATPELAGRARKVARERALTLADVLDAGCDRLEEENAS